MNIYRMTAEELGVASSQASQLAMEIGKDKPLLALILLDAAELALDEILVHMTKGDRGLAKKLKKMKRPLPGDH